MTAWLYLENEETGGTSRVPDDPTVRDYFEARGWRVVDEPADEPVTSPAGAVPDLPKAAADAVDGAEVDTLTGQAWVELVHPLDGAEGGEARSRVPADPVAVAGLLELGWVLPRKTDGGVPARARRAATRAAEQQHDEVSPAADASGEQSTSGPDTATDTKEQ